MGLVCTVTVLLVLVSFAVGGVADSTYSVVDYGAKGDGITDDTKAFSDAWKAACGDAAAPTFLIPSGSTFLLGEIRFEGPCKSNINFQVDGDLLRPSQMWAGQVESWILFHRVEGLAIYGAGVIDGQGAAYWACKKNRQCSLAPNALVVLNSNNWRLSGLRLVNSPQMHVVVGFSAGVQIHDLNITAPEDSPNTDGVHIEQCQHVSLWHSIIGTGDDCVSIGNGTYDVNVSRITCGPGHGISIGSLGAQDSLAQVEQIHVSDSNIFNTMNGIRIKTWQGGFGYARTISFDHINLAAVDNPIIIDQYYCPNIAQGCANQTSNVQVSDVQFASVTGTSSSKVAINLRCSQSVPCTGISLQDVNIQPAQQGGQVDSYCLGVHGSQVAPVVPAVACLS